VLRREDAVAGHIAGLRARLHDTAHDDIIDVACIDTGLLHEGVEHRGSQADWVPITQCPILFGTGGTDTLDDIGSFGHRV